MAQKYIGLAGLTGAGDNTRTRKPRGPTSGGADGTSTVTVNNTDDVDNNVDRFIDRIIQKKY